MLKMEIKIDHSSYICRVCEKDINLTYIFNETNNSIPKQLQSLADVKIEKDDGLPKFVCKECIESLDKAYKFKIQCEYTDRKLRNVIDEKQDERANSEPGENKFDQSDHLKEYNVHFDIIEENHNPIHIVFSDATCEESTIQSKQLESQECIIKNENKLSFCEGNSLGEEFPNLLFAEENITCYKISKPMLVKQEQIVEKTEDEFDKSLEDEEAEISSGDEDDSDINIQGKKLKEGTKSNKKLKVHVCEMCGDGFDDFIDLEDHIKAHGTKRYQCSECNRWFRERYYLEMHQQMNHADQNKYICPECHKQYSNGFNLNRHVRAIHKNERKHVCNKCGKGFSQLTILKQHYNVHLETRDFECEVCQKSYKTEKHLNLHKECHIPLELRNSPGYKRKRYLPKKKICICIYCGKKSNTLSIHINHMKTHTGEKPHECTFCEKKFSTLHLLKNHLLVHTGEKPFKCDLCGLSFRQMTHLKCHQLVHTGEKRHKCKTCEKTFALRGNLTVHMRLHTGETPYHCTLCSKKFHDINGLKRHRQVHLKENIKQENES